MIRHQPQTLRQAKRAYQKAGSHYRISEAERRHLDRQAELQERADKIKAKERRKKVARQKKDEKMAKIKEARRSAGLPKTEQPRINASQLKVSDFLKEATKPKSEDVTAKEAVGDGFVAGHVCGAGKAEGSNNVNLGDEEVDTTGGQQEPDLVARAPALNNPKFYAMIIKGKEDHSRHESPTLEHLSGRPDKRSGPWQEQRSSTHSSTPPKLTNATKATPVPDPRAPSAPVENSPVLGDGWADMFVSGTQIEQELTASYPSSVPLASACQALIDLPCPGKMDFSSHQKVKRAKADRRLDMPQRQEESETTERRMKDDSDLGLTEEDMNGFSQAIQLAQALESDLQSHAPPHPVPCTPLTTKASICTEDETIFSDFALTSQELLELGRGGPPPSQVPENKYPVLSETSITSPALVAVHAVRSEPLGRDLTDPEDHDIFDKGMLSTQDLLELGVP